MFEEFKENVYDENKPSIVVLGDCHGRFNDVRKILDSIWKEDPSLIVYQVGDFGIGFPNHPCPDNFGDNFKFFPGNHDNRQIALKHKNCIGNYGYIEEHDLYFISGAWSIDHNHRIIGIDIWPDEELSYDDFDTIQREILEYQPRIILSHDCPSSIRKEMFGFDRFYETKTGMFLTELFNKYQPTFYCCGHYHRQSQKMINGTHFICLQELQWCKIPL